MSASTLLPTSNCRGRSLSRLATVDGYDVIVTWHVVRALLVSLRGPCWVSLWNCVDVDQW